MKICLIVGLCLVAACSASDLPGHHKPFGWGNTIPVEEIQGFPPVKTFFEEYVRKNRAVVMRGANKVWPGYENWQSDKYFKSAAPEEPYMVSIDKKRGSPDAPSKYVSFKDFIDMYNTSKRRMVEVTPEFLLDDVLVPRCLDCPAITQGTFLMGNKMWFGADYTTSVVHKDAADNINCLVYGVKNYTMVDIENGKHVLLDRPDGLFSTMDVDDVDFNKYPGLEKVQYQISELHGGDCIFVPYKWIHQVRSYGRNIAVNIWWNYWKDNEVDISECPDDVEGQSIRNAKFHGWGDFETRDVGVREHVGDLIAMTREELSLTRFILLFTLGLNAEDDEVDYVDGDITEALAEAHKIIDLNKNSKITSKEFESLEEEPMKQVIEHIKYVFTMTRIRSQEVQDVDKETEKEKKFGRKKSKPSQEEMKKMAEEQEKRDEL